MQSLTELAALIVDCQLRTELNSKVKVKVIFWQTVSKFETPRNLKGQVLVFVSHRNRVGQLYPQSLSWTKFRSYFTTDGQSVCLGVEHPCGTWDQILLLVWMLLSEICGLVSVGRPLWWEDGSAIHSVITQWSESCRTCNHTLLSHLRLPQPGGPDFHIHIPQEQGGPVILSGIGFPFKRARLKSKLKSHCNWQVSQSVCQGIEPTLGLVARYYFLSKGCFLKFAIVCCWLSLIRSQNGPHRKHHSSLLYHVTIT
jgi:hypothetical protein